MLKVQETELRIRSWHGIASVGISFETLNSVNTYKIGIDT